MTNITAPTVEEIARRLRKAGTPLDGDTLRETAEVMHHGIVLGIKMFAASRQAEFSPAELFFALLMCAEICRHECDMDELMHVPPGIPTSALMSKFWDAFEMLNLKIIPVPTGQGLPS